MLGIPLGLAASNATEWLVHKYVLHGLGRRKGSFWAFHWHDHHKNARRNDHVDPDYERPLFSHWNGQSKEALALVARRGRASRRSHRSRRSSSAR